MISLKSKIHPCLLWARSNLDSSKIHNDEEISRQQKTERLVKNVSLLLLHPPSKTVINQHSDSSSFSPLWWDFCLLHPLLFFFIYLGVSHLLCFGGEAEKQVWSALEQLFQRQTRCVPVITDSLSTHKIMGHGNSEAFMILYLLRWVQWAASLQVTLNKYMIIQFSEKDFSWDSQSQY